MDTGVTVFVPGIGSKGGDGEDLQHFAGGGRSTAAVVIELDAEGGALVL